MKKLILIAIITLGSLNTGFACEICGCGLGNYYIGLLPQFKHRFVGLRYQSQRFNTVLSGDPTQFSKDYYRTTELWAGWNIGKKWQVLAIIPYNFIHQVSDDGVTNNQGIGDIAMMVNYKVFDKTCSVCKGRSLQQQLWFGGGIKIPTGKFEIDATDPAIVALANTQTGSASTDFMLNAMYIVRVDKIGINTSTSYKINTINKDKYSFGNKFSASSYLSYTINSGQVAIVPNVGILYENTAVNKLQKEKVAQTGGNLLSTAAGVELSFKRFTVGANIQLPLHQNFAEGQTELRSRGMAHIAFSF